MWWRYGCGWELEGNGEGRIYEEYNTGELFWVGTDEYFTWESCLDCGTSWEWEECSGMWYRFGC